MLLYIETATKIKPIAPRVAKQFLEDYYNKLFSRAEKRLSDDLGKRARTGKLSKSKRRCISFNQTELQRQKVKGLGSEVRESRTRVRRMSVDVGLFLGQKGLQVRAGSRIPVELSPMRESRDKEMAGTTTTAAERDTLENMEESAEIKTPKHGIKKKESKKLKRSFRLGSTEEEESSETLSSTSPQTSQIPVSGGRQGKGKRFLKKTQSIDLESSSCVSIAEKPTGLGGGKTEKKSKFASSFPRRQWSWRSKKMDELSSQEKHHTHERSSSEVGEGRRLSSGKDVTKVISNLVENNFSSSTPAPHTVGDSWTSPTPKRAFNKHTSL